jgi:predicted amidohydrolase
MKMALIQYSLSEDMETNLTKALHLTGTAADKGSQLICFPELCLSPFFPQIPKQDASRYSIKIGHNYVRRFQAACKRLKVVAVPNVYLEEDSRRYDASLVINTEGEIQGVSKMVHVAQAPCFYEQDYYTPSDTGFKVYETSFGRVGVVVCFDRHYPESIRTCVLRGAQLIVVPTANIESEPKEMFEWELRVAAMQNGVYIAMCNRVGTEGAVTFCGESIIVDPNGKVLTRAENTEGITLADIDLGEVEVARRRRPFLSLRRPELYER